MCQIEAAVRICDGLDDELSGEPGVELGFRLVLKLSDVLVAVGIGDDNEVDVELDCAKDG